jgi:hypothetical protein
MKRNFHFLLPVFLIALSLLQACDIINPAEEIPSYIRIEKFEFTLTDVAFGAPTTKITDAWVYVNEELVGAYELPAEFPVLAKGMAKVSIRPGIKMNGVAATRVMYNFYIPYTTNVALKPKEITTITPTTSYHPSTTVAWLADFEGEMKIDTLPNSNLDIEFEISSSIINPSINGFACGKIGLTKDKNFFAATSLRNFPFELPKNGQSVFLEMDYKNDQNFSVGVMAINPLADQAITIMHLRPSATWNKIYINLTTTLQLPANFEAKGYYFYTFAALNDSLSQANIYIDNLKILY